LQKVDKSSGAHFQALSWHLKMFLFLMFLNIQINLIILKTDDEQFTLTTKKPLTKFSGGLPLLPVYSFKFRSAFSHGQPSPQLLSSSQNSVVVINL